LDPRSKFALWEKTISLQRDIDADKETVRLAWQDFQQKIVPEGEFTDYITDRLSPATDAFDVLHYRKIREQHIQPQ
jgi:hypothetical protein